jgi:hypothetical protein
MPRDEETTRPILARCTKCGRGYITIGTARPWIDRYYPPGTWPTKKNPHVDECGGTVELTEAGRAEVARLAAT